MIEALEFVFYPVVATIKFLYSFVDNHEAITFPVGAFLFGGVSAQAISYKHARELYILWYIFAVFLLLFFALDLAAGWQNRELRDYLGYYAFLYDWVTNLYDELLLVAGVLYLGLGPQILTYVFSGPFGAASSPIFVRQIRAVALLSLAKFLMGFSAIAFAEGLSALALRKGLPYSSLKLGASGLCMALAVAATHYVSILWTLRLPFRVAELVFKEFPVILLLQFRRAAWRNSIIRLLLAQIQLTDLRFIDLSFLEMPRRGTIIAVLAIHRFFTRRTRSPGPAEPAMDGLIGFNVSVDIPLFNYIRRLFSVRDTFTSKHAESTEHSAVTFRVAVSPKTDAQVSTTKS